ncbi:MAG: ABC transporter substrate-binding protein [Desulfosoma sp.]|uniref:ABC transporter substrate-binding protein n=2 Tax=Desulfosoma sp. TaxID=2603217 RepID=UPI004049CE66
MVTWMPPTTVKGKRSIMHEIMTRLGAVNHAKNMDVRTMDVPFERILEWRPELILTGGYAHYGPEWFLQRPQWHAIPAVRHRHVYKLPTWSTASPRVASMSLFMAMKI